MFETNVLLCAHSNYKIGGEARYFFQSKKAGELARAAAKARSSKLPVFILGGGTNLLFNDNGFDGLVIKPTMDGIKQVGDAVVVGAGAKVADLLDFTVSKGLSGLEWAGGLPGFVGGAIRGNAGAFGGEIKDNLIEVVSMDFSGKLIKRKNSQCFFKYRDSIYKSGPNAGKEIIIEASFQLKPGNKKDIKKLIREKIDWRKERQPLDYPNIGSIFKNVDVKKVPAALLKNQPEVKSHIKTDPFPVIPTAYLIHQAGLKGVVCGGAMISPKHPNFIVNSLGASATDVKNLIVLVKTAIRDKYGIDLEEEVMFV